MDTDLTDEGRVQVDTRARAVCAMPYVRMELQGAQVLTSPRRRTRQTEQAFREVSRLGPAVVSGALDEIWPWEYGVERGADAWRAIRRSACTGQVVIAFSHHWRLLSLLSYLGVDTRLSSMGNAALIRLEMVTPGPETRCPQITTVGIVGTGESLPPVYRFCPAGTQSPGYCGELGPPELIDGYAQIHDRTMQMIRDARTSIVLSVFEFDGDFKPTGASIVALLAGALERGVKVHVQTSALNPNCRSITNDGLRALGRRFPTTLRLDLNRVRVGDLPFINGLHRKFLCTDQGLMLGGPNCSQYYSDANESHQWWETVVCFPRMDPAILVLLRDRVWSCQPPPIINSHGLLFDNTSQYRAILGMIDRAEHSLYIECQYFLSGVFSQNEVSEALIRSIERAGREGRSFHVVIVTNRSFEPDSLFNGVLPAVAVRACLQRLMARADLATDGRGHDFLSVLVAPGGWYIHSKLFAADGRHVMHTTCNIFDGSFHADGHGELGWVSYDNPEVYRAIAGRSWDALRACVPLIVNDNHHYTVVDGMKCRAAAIMSGPLLANMSLHY